jgi:hypothetical protein
MEPDNIPIAITSRGAPVVFSRHERERHVYIVGKSGSGKSIFLYNLAVADIMAGEGVAVIDPHGDLALEILDAIPHSRINHVCYLDVTDADHPVGFNPATGIAPGRRALAAAGIVSAFKHLWSDSWGPRLEHFLFHGVAALISRRAATLIDLPRVFMDDSFRARLLRSVIDPETLRFWHEEFPGYTKAFRSEAIAPILNKAGQFAASPQLRLILGQVAPRLDLKFTMDNRRLLIANLAKGAIGEQASNLLGSLLVPTSNSSPWSGAVCRRRSAYRFSCTWTNSRPSARTPSRPCFQRPASSPRILRSQISTLISSPLPCVRP